MPTAPPQAAAQPVTTQAAPHAATQPAAVVHAAHGAGSSTAHGAGPSAPLQRAIPVKQAVAVGSPPAQPPTTRAPAAPAAARPSPAVTHPQTVSHQQAIVHPAAASVAAPVAPQPVLHATVPVAPPRPAVPAAPAARRRRGPSADEKRHPSDGLAYAGLALGLVGLPLGLAPYYGFVVSGFGALLAIAAMFAAIRLRKSGGLAVAALATCGIGLCFQVSMWNQYWRERPETDEGAGAAHAAKSKPASTAMHSSANPSATPAATPATATAAATPAGTAASAVPTSTSPIPTAATPTGTSPQAAAASQVPLPAPVAYEPWQQKRVWTIGDMQVTARLKSWSGTRAILQKEDGETINTSQSALSDEDRAWVEKALGK